MRIVLWPQMRFSPSITPTAPIMTPSFKNMGLPVTGCVRSYGGRGVISSGAGVSPQRDPNTQPFPGKQPLFFPDKLTLPPGRFQPSRSQGEEEGAH